MQSHLITIATETRANPVYSSALTLVLSNDSSRLIASKNICVFIYYVYINTHICCIYFPNIYMYINVYFYIIYYI